MSLPEIDTSLFIYINSGLQNSFFDVVMPFVTSNAKLLFLPLAVWVFLKDGKRVWPVLITAIIAAVLADWSGHLLKDLFARQRPCNSLENVNLLVGCGHSFSMPSNHASNSFAFATVFWLLRRDSAGPAFLLVAALIALSRIFVGVHYPSDVAAGAPLCLVFCFG